MYYEMYGRDRQNSKNIILFLHGWGQNLKTFYSVKDKLDETYCIMLVDFLGFGKSDEPNCLLDVLDYVEDLHALLTFLEIKKPNIVGHSFGGRVAIKYAAKYGAFKICLVDSAGIREKSVKRFIKIRKYKVKKVFYRTFWKAKYELLLQSSGSVDYQNASPIMRGTMSRVIKEDLRKYLKKIEAPTLLVWGILDQETPYHYAMMMNQKLKYGKIVPFYKSGHFPYIDEEHKFIKELTMFLRE